MAWADVYVQKATLSPTAAATPPSFDTRPTILYRTVPAGGLSALTLAGAASATSPNDGTPVRDARLALTTQPGRLALTTQPGRMEIA